MASHKESIIREPLITGEGITYAQITNDVLSPVENAPNKAWWIVLSYPQLAHAFGCLQLAGRFGTVSDHGV